VLAVGRVFESLRLTRDMCAGLREAIRPFKPVDRDETAAPFCDRLYAAFYVLEADADLEAVDFLVDAGDIMLINDCVSAEEGDWAKDVLHQTRQALHELRTGKHAVRLAPADSTDKLLAGLHLDPDEPAVGRVQDK
jgi:hypothetical protein